MFDQNDNRLLSLRAFSSASQPRFLQMWSNHFLHHYKASVLFLVALLSFVRIGLFVSIHKIIVPFLYWDPLFHYLFSLKQIESTLKFQNNTKI